MIAVDAELRKWLLRVWVLLFCSCLLTHQVQAADSNEQDSKAASSQDLSGLNLELGFNGMWKLGQACPVQVSFSPEIALELSRFEIGTVDGDGVPVSYQFEVADKGAAMHRAVIRIGRSDRNLVIRALGSDEQLLVERVYYPEQLPEALPSSQPFVVAIGSTMGVEELARKTTGSGLTLSTVAIDSAKQLPSSWRAYTGCDVLVISTANSDLLADLDKSQWKAISDWIERGGGAVISVAPSSSNLVALQELLPDEIEESVFVSNPAALETLVSTKQRLDDFEAVKFDQTSGNVELYLTDSLSKRIPWWISYVRGRGTLRLIASDLDAPAFAEWPDRRALWERILVSYLDRKVFDPSAREEVTANVSYLGYRDMVGQLRAMLDAFSGVAVLSFSQIAAMVIGVLLLIGPMDYLISVKWLKRPELSWYVAGVMLLAMSIGLTFLYLKLRPNEVIINSAQIIDVDVSTGDVDGRLWAHIYSGRAKRFDVEANSRRGDQQDSSEIYLDWQGLPGSGLGGLQSQLDVDRGMPAYKIIERNNGSLFEGVGIPTAGSKSLFGSWKQNLEITRQSSLQETDGVDQVQGELVNPLPFELKEPMLFYHGWYYLLNSRLRPGEAISISFDMIPKDLKRRLNGRIRGKEGIDTAKAWDPAERENIDRLLEIMMFYKAASGSNYTALVNRYQPQVDQSNLINLDRAILVGKYGGDELPVEFRISESGSTNDESGSEFTVGKSTTWVRVAIPVARPKK